MFLEHLRVPCPVSAAGDGDVIETPWLWSGTSCGTFNPVGSLGSRLRDGDQSVGHRLESGLGRNMWKGGERHRFWQRGMLSPTEVLCTSEGALELR